MKTPKRCGKIRKKKHVLKNKLAYIFLGFLLILICLLAYSHLNPATPEQTPKAAIVDHLSLSQPNPNFSQTIQAIINETKLKIDHYLGPRKTMINIIKIIDTHLIA